MQLQLFNALAYWYGFKDEHHAFWWRATVPSLQKLMAECKYDFYTQYLHLMWYNQYILPALGPRPVFGKTPQWKHHLTHDGSPFEPSRSGKELMSKSVVRFTIEPVGFLAGTDEDPFNQNMAKTLIKQLAVSSPEVHQQWFDHFAQELFLLNNAAQNVYRKLPPNETIPQSLLAFDLVDRKVMVKAYFFPILKSIHTGTPATKIISSAVSRLDEKGFSLSPALSLFNEFLRNCTIYSPPHVEMIAIDCIDPTKARFKVYSRTFHNTFAKVRDIYTLGGRLKGEDITAGVEALEQLWPILFALQETDFHDVELPHVENRSAGVVYNFEITSGDRFPKPKLYFPMWHYADNDAAISERLEAFFKRRGWTDMALSYRQGLKASL